jgi:hypothetical protein
MKAVLLVVLLAVAFPAHAALQFFDSDVGEYVVWRVGDPSPVSQLPDYDYGDQLWCEATGPELVYVQAHFSGIKMMTVPAVKGATPDVQWLNADCEFLLNNL